MVEHHTIMFRQHVATVLMIEPEMPESVSPHKLVLETAKHNVITAYGGIEGLALFKRFPNVDAVFLHSELNDFDCGKVAEQIRGANATVPIVVLSPTGHTRCGTEITQVLPSHEPQRILDYMSEQLQLPVSN
jgi:CheY-like chemotaxis protein